MQNELGKVDYIDRLAFIKNLQNARETNYLGLIDDDTVFWAIHRARCFPAADVENHAHWVYKKYDGNLATYSNCSLCGFQYNASILDTKTFKSIIDPKNEYKYCPLCGARMDEVGEEE